MTNDDNDKLCDLNTSPRIARMVKSRGLNWEMKGIHTQFWWEKLLENIQLENHGDKLYARLMELAQDYLNSRLW
jgi:hypothetical protein